jgi:tetratricopeptide (TPR) repeat protein
MYDSATGLISYAARYRSSKVKSADNGEEQERIVLAIRGWCMGCSKLKQWIIPSVMALLSICAYGQSRDAAKEHAIERQLEQISPGSVESFKQATEALDRNDFAEAVPLYRQVLDTAPDFDPARRRLGMALVQLGQTDEGLTLLSSAVTHERSPENLISLAFALAVPPEGSPGTDNMQKAMVLAKEAFMLNNDPDALFLYTNMAVRLQSMAEFKEAVSFCKANFPEEMLTRYYSAIEAAVDEDWTRAETEIKRAGELGLDQATVDKFLDSGVHRHVLIWRYTFLALYLLGVWAAGLVLIYIFGKVMSARMMDAIKNLDPDQIRSRLGRSFKRTYRTLMNFAGVYYYISLPVLIILLIAVVGSIFYAFLALGRIPIKLMIVLAIVTFTTIYQMIRTLFIRQEPRDPGRGLAPEEAPGLRWLLNQVADTVGTRPVDQIRITPGTELAVYEKGNRRARAKDEAQRMLILGVGVLDGFGLNAFRAVIAHEYGHFAHRDTAGGDVAFRVNADMTKFILAIVYGGLAVWYNCAFHFLRLYHFLFRRISHGASRLQEIMADIAAATYYGASAFEEGLKHVVSRDINFAAAAQRVQNDASLKTYTGLRSLYEPAALEAGERNSLEEQMEKSLSRPTSDDDTHPSPSDRFALARRVQSIPRVEEDGFVWDLFADREGLTQEMVKLMGRNFGIKEAAGQ